MGVIRNGEGEKKKSIIREYAEAIIIAILLALIIRTFVIQAFKIPSGSMIPTLLIGDHILVNKFIYWFEDPERGDIAVFKYPQDPKRDFIKRVVGLPGEKLEIRNKVVYINGEPLDEAYTIFTDNLKQSRVMSQRDTFGPVVIPENSYFMMGDNRDNSADSRFWGFLDKNMFKGKAFIIYWSWRSSELEARETDPKWEEVSFHGLRWKRFGKLLH